MSLNNYRAVAFSNPGEHGIIPLIGALWAAESNGFLTEITAWICPSTTSLLAIMSVCGYKWIEIMAILDSSPEMMVPHIPFKNPTILGNDISALKIKFTEIIKNKLKNIPTLKQFQEKYETTLVTIGFSLEQQENEFIHADTHPDMNLVDFLCISFSTPGIYKPYENYWLDGSINDPFPVDSIQLETGKILGIHNCQSMIKLKADDPLTQVKNVMRCFNESKRFSSIRDLPNLVNIIILTDDISIYEKSEIPTPFNDRLVIKLGDEIVGKLKCGWHDFMTIHFDVVREIEEDEAEQQE